MLFMWWGDRRGRVGGDGGGGGVPGAEEGGEHVGWRVVCVAPREGIEGGERGRACSERRRSVEEITKRLTEINGD